jgi:hypothetical protein
MSTNSLWPSWVTTEQVRRLTDLGLRFTWLVTQEETESSPSVYGQWVRALEQEVNVALREQGACFVGVYPRGQGFWPGRSPAMATAETSHTGTFHDVLDVAVKLAVAREGKP